MTTHLTGQIRFARHIIAGLLLSLISGFAIAAPEAPWPMDGHDAQHTGRSPFVGPSSPIQLWEASVVDATRNIGLSWYGTVIGSDGSIYISERHAVHALTPEGKEKWVFTVETTSPPAIGPNGTIYIGSDKLYALTPEGKQQWVFSSPTPFDGTIESPVIGKDGIIYFGMDKMHALNPDGKQKWSFSPGMTWWWRSPALGSNDTVYAVGDSKLYAINSDGTLKWSNNGNTKRSEGYNSAPIVDGRVEDVVYLSSSEHSPTAYCAIDKYGEQIWKYNIRGGMCSSAASGFHSIFVISSEGILYSIDIQEDEGGTHEWMFAIKNDSFICARPVVGGDGTIYVCGGDNIYAVKDDGTLKWTFPLKGIDPQTLVIGDKGIIYVCTIDGKLHAIGDKK